MTKRRDSKDWPVENLEGFHKALSQLDSLEFYSVCTGENAKKQVNIPRSDPKSSLNRISRQSNISKNSVTRNLEISEQNQLFNESHDINPRTILLPSHLPPNYHQLQNVLDQRVQNLEIEENLHENSQVNSQVSSTDYNDLVHEWDSISAHLERRQQASEIRKSVAKLRQKIDGLDDTKLNNHMNDEVLEEIYKKNMEESSNSSGDFRKVDKLEPKKQEATSKSQKSTQFDKLADNNKIKPPGIKRSKSIYDRFAGALTFSNSTKRINKPLIKRKQSKENQMENSIQYKIEDILARTKTENSDTSNDMSKDDVLCKFYPSLL